MNLMEIFTHLIQSRRPTPGLVTRDPETARDPGRRVLRRDGMVAADSLSSSPRLKTLAADC